MRGDEIEVSVVVPVFNEQDSVRATIESLNRILDNLGLKYEIIAVDDGSTDGTWHMLTGLKAKIPFLATLQHETNAGYGAAIKTALSRSAFAHVLIIDADQTYPVESIPLFIDRAREYDMVVGSRTTQEARIPWIRKPAKLVLKWLAEFLSARKIPDLNSGFRLFKKDLALKHIHVFPDGFSFTSTLTLLFLHDGRTIHYVPIDYFKRQGKSKIRPLRDTFNFVQLIIRTILYVNPLRIFIPASFFFLGLSSLLFFIRVVFGPAFLATTIISFVCGFQLLVVGMLADLIDKRLR
ncbi:MAG: glycosyltransferase family 2 protein [Pseudomonadota bacterium]